MEGRFETAEQTPNSSDETTACVAESWGGRAQKTCSAETDCAHGACRCEAAVTTIIFDAKHGKTEEAL